MIAVALVVGFPVYVLVNLAVRAPSDTSLADPADHVADPRQLRRRPGSKAASAAR